MVELFEKEQKLEDFKKNKRINSKFGEMKEPKIFIDEKDELINKEDNEEKEEKEEEKEEKEEESDKGSKNSNE